MQTENFKLRNFLLYVFFGVATTGVNIICYYLCSRWLHQDTILSNISAWTAAVTFAYITNKKWVFESKAAGWKQILTEMAAFFFCRFVTGLIDIAIMFVGVDILKLNDMALKFISNLIVILVNYAASKGIIFKSKER